MASDELVQKILTIVRTNLNPRQGLTNLKKTTNIVPGIMKIIKDNLGEAPAVVSHAPVNDVKISILKLVENKIKIPPKVVAAVNTKMGKEGGGNFFKTILGFFSPKNKMATSGPGAQPNFIEAKITGKNNQGRPTYNQVAPMSGYVFTTQGNKTGWFKNTGGAVPPVGPKPPVGPNGPKPPVNVPAAPRNYTKMALRNLLNARRKYPDNKEAISKAIQKVFENELRGVRYDGRTKRARRIGDLLRILPRNFNGRRNATALVIDDIRNTRNKTNLSNLKSNLGSVPNEDVRRAFDEQRRRLERRKSPYGYENEYRGRTRYGESESRRFSPRRSGESNYNYGRRREEYNRNEMRRRREAHSRSEIPSSGGNGGFRGNSGPRRNFGPRGNMGGGGNMGPPPIPSNEQRAINNAGGATKALNRIANVPGGAPEVAKAAEALNETNGNVSKAIYIKGASPAAVEAVKNLGGHANAVNVLSGLNTMSQKSVTRVRKSTRTRKSKVLRPRVAELNRVINAVKKQRLISLVAHNVTKTHDIHPNDEKLKKYYKKVIKANILRRPFAKIAKKAAKKRVA
jgi:hypothetical protein